VAHQVWEAAPLHGLTLQGKAIKEGKYGKTKGKKKTYTEPKSTPRPGCFSCPSHRHSHYVLTRGVRYTVQTQRSTVKGDSVVVSSGDQPLLTSSLSGLRVGRVTAADDDFRTSGRVRGGLKTVTAAQDGLNGGGVGGRSQSGDGGEESDVRDHFVEECGVCVCVWCGCVRVEVDELRISKEVEVKVE
jgi:hypothetical protein